MYLLDTKHCRQIIAGNRQVIQTILNRRSAGVAISVIVQGELRFMAEHSARRTENLDRIQGFLERFDLYPISVDISNTYASLKALLFKTFGPKDQAQRRKTRIQAIGFDDNDLWITATAIQHQLILVSADRDFDRMQQVSTLQVESWMA